MCFEVERLAEQISRSAASRIEPECAEDHRKCDRPTLTGSIVDLAEDHAVYRPTQTSRGDVVDSVCLLVGPSQDLMRGCRNGDVETETKTKTIFTARARYAGVILGV